MRTGVAAVVAWIVTAGFGLTLFGTWLRRGGITQHTRRDLLALNLPPPCFPAPLVLSHLVLAAGGLLVWIAYLLTGSRVLALIAALALLPVALFGFSMFGRWLGSRRLRVDPGPGRMLPEARLPSAIVLCHGLGATTIVLVLLATGGVGGG
jgi:hypothetical protein